MKFIPGIEISKKYFYEYGLPMLEEEFKEYLPRMACGVVGHGSECFGFDDEISKDHDYEPGFTIWLTEEDYKEIEFKLFRAYQKLPREYMGVEIKNTSVFGSKYKGVHTINEFYKFYTLSGKEPTTLDEWVNIPSFYLAEATNGEVFLDNLGEFSRIRNILKNGMPDDAFYKRLASSLFLMAQSGQYNYERCYKHNEKGAASLAISKFVEQSIEVIFLLNKKYAPYYKWSLRAMKDLDKFNEYSSILETLITNPLNFEENIKIIEKLATKIINELKDYNIEGKSNYLEEYAYLINDKIKDNNLRSSPIII